jgi:23S rRNA (cytosine1962-C5)-methyltransferase
MLAGRWIEAKLARELEISDTTAYRLSSGEGWWMERFGRSALISVRNQSEAPELVAELLRRGSEWEWMPCHIFCRLLVREPGQTDVPFLMHHSEGSDDVLPHEIVLESGLQYEIDFSASYSPGLFPDQRANRHFLRSRRPARVLNAFSYTCAFSVAAGSEGAETTSVDISKSSLQRGRRNFELNNIATDRHRFIPEDVPTYLSRLRRRGEKFNAIILDPPTFGRGGAGKTFRVERDFGALLEVALDLSCPGSAILMSTNFTGWSERELISLARNILPRGSKFHREPVPPDFFGESPSSTLWAILPTS